MRLGGGGVIRPVSPSFPNVGQILINPQFLQTSGAYEFLNLMKHAQLPWILGDNTGYLSPADTDANGYPTALRVVQGVYTVTEPPSSASRPGNYVFTWTGNGTIDCPGSTLVSGSFTGSGGSGRAVVSTPGNQIKITALPVTNLSFFHSADETDINNGLITGKQFRQRITQAQSPVFRSLNWIGGYFAGTNSTPIATWADRKPVGYVSYVGMEYRASQWAGATTNSGNDYSITFGSGSPTDKQHIILNFNAAGTDHSATVTITNGTPSTVNWTSHGLSVNDPIAFGGFSGPNLPSPMNLFMNFYVQNVVDANTINISATRGGAALNTTGSSSNLTAMRCPTLSLNGTTPVPLRDANGFPMWSTGGNLVTTTGYYGLTYDAGINQWYTWGGASGFENGVPPEVFLQVCKEIGCHPWFVSPPMSVDPMTDWHVQLATYVRNNAPPWMIPRFECLNEPWNLLTQVSTRSRAYSFINWQAINYGDVPNFIGKIASTIGQDLNSVLGPVTGNNYHLIINIQTGLTTDWNDGLNSSSYVGQSAPAQAGYIKAAAKNYLTHVTINQYMNSSANENTANTNWQNAVGAAAKQAVVDGYLDDASLGFPGPANTSPDGVIAFNAIYTSTFSWCQGFTNSQGAKIRMCGYEGGVESTVNSSLYAFWDACMTAGTNMQKYCTQNYQNFIAAGGEHPALFQMAGVTPRDNVWSALTDIYQTPDNPEWSAVLTFNH